MAITLFYRFLGATMEDNRKNKKWRCIICGIENNTEHIDCKNFK
jgi:hypothetical protein